jgi:phosphate transport system substrate-binding protein
MIRPSIVSAIVIGFAVVAACINAAEQIQNLTGSIKIDGSSTVFPISTAVDEAFREAGSRVKVVVGNSGTGGGFKRFVVGEIDISNASRPIKKDELDQTAKNNVQFIELPIAFDGLSIVVNKANYWVETLTLDDLRFIFRAGNPARTWKDIRSEWPDKPIRIHAPGTDSGTFEYFRDEVVGKDGKLRSDMSVSEDDNVLVRGVVGEENSIGFFGFAYYLQNKDQLKLVKVDAGKGPVEPTNQTIENGTYSPFSRPLFIYVNKKSAARPEVRAFVEFYLNNVSTLVEEVGYVKIPQAVLEKAKANFAQQRTGTQFINEKGEKISGPLVTVYN